MEINYTRLPQHMQGAAKRYIEQGYEGGSFLTAVFSNQLVGAFGRADDGSRAAMAEWASFLYNDAPTGCWGSLSKVNAWIDHRGLSGIGQQEKEVSE